MSIIHVNQIKNHISHLFENLIDLSDQSNASPEQLADFFLTRSLAAYSLTYLIGISPEAAALSVTDGGEDNGIDAIYYDEPTKKLYFVQSKWIKDGTGEPSNGDVKKFLAGVLDLFNMQFDRFNVKVQSKETSIVQALRDPATRYEVVLIYTGSNRLAIHSQRDFDDLVREMNDTSEVVYVSILNQASIYASIITGIAEPIHLDIGLKSWGKKDAPHEAYYGQVDGQQIADWWSTYRTRLFARNLRSMLGESEVNTEMRQSIIDRPDEFWYFNNGITIVAKRAEKAMAGGASHDFSTFHCTEANIVNGAQTVGTIGKFSETNQTLVSSVYVPVRIIVLGDNNYFGEEVTRTNNRQNKIENRDFVALDPEQGRIRSELAVDGIDYQVVRSETVSRNDTSFDLVEATTALACASVATKHAVQLKREIGKLWDDISRAPYRELFNGSVHGLYVWRCAQVQRRIDKALDSRHRRITPRHPRQYPIATHGNRIVASLVFNALPLARFREPAFNIEEVASEDIIALLVDSRLDALVLQVETHYNNSILPTLFKNLRKCEDLVSKVANALSQTH